MRPLISRLVCLFSLMALAGCSDDPVSSLPSELESVGSLESFDSSAPALSGTQDDARFALHAQSVKAGNSCVDSDPTSSGIPCSQYTTEWPVGAAANVYVVIVQGDAPAGITAAAFGMNYDPVPGSGVDVISWTQCSDVEFLKGGPNGEWPAPGSGIWLSWGACNQSVVENEGLHVVAGSFYVYAYDDDLMRVTANEVTLDEPQFVLMDCDFMETTLPPSTPGGEIAFGTGSGITPCEELSETTVYPMDLRPGDCPDLLREHGQLKVAILGTASLGVDDIDVSTVQLEGVSPRGSRSKDVAGDTGAPCDCIESGKDGFDDLLFRFSIPSIRKAIEPVADGDEVLLTLTGLLMNGDPFEARDCVVIESPGGSGPLEGQ